MELIALRLRARLWVNRPTIARIIAAAREGNVERQAADRRFDAIADGSNFLSTAAIQMVCVDRQMAVDTAVETEVQKT
jgi:hypothetical protein